MGNPFAFPSGDAGAGLGAGMKWVLGFFDTYKAVQHSANVISMEPILQGLRKPVNNLTRDASVDDILSTIALTAVQAQKAEDI